MEVAKTIATGGLLGSVQIFISTVPVPLASFAGCTSCLWKWGEDLNNLLNGADAGDTKRYFAAGRCNANAVGLCMMLEKVRFCGHRVEWKRADIARVRGRDKVTANQKQLCDAFKGVKLRLTKIEGNIRCPEVYRDQTFYQTRKRALIQESDVTQVDLQQGCHRVRRTLMQYNKACGKRPQEGLWQKVQEKVGNYVYYDEAGTGALEPVAMKCRALFGCLEEGLNTSIADTDTDWSFLTSELRSIIAQVDDLSGRPRSHSPQQAVNQIVRLLDATTRRMTSIEGKTSQALATQGVREVAPWGGNLEDVFLAEEWDDRCFAGLSPRVDAWRETTPGARAPPAPVGTNRLAQLYRRYGNPAVPGNRPSRKNFRFFQLLSDAMKVWTWTGNGKCDRHGAEKAAATRWFRQQLAVRAKKATPIIDAIVMNQLQRWELGWDKGTLSLQSLGLPAEASFELQQVSKRSHEWRLWQCTGSTCGGVNIGARLRRLTLRGVRGPDVKRFREAAFGIVSAIYYIDGNVTQHGWGIANPGLPMQGREDFRKAAAIFSTWKAGLLQQPVPRNQLGTRQAWDATEVAFFSQLAASGRHRELLELVQGSPDLAAFFERRGWTFEEAAHGGASQWRLHLLGKPLGSLAQLERLLTIILHRNWDVIINIRDSIREVGLSMLASAKNRTVWDALDDVNRENPFAKLSTDPLYQCIGGSAENDTRAAACEDEGISHVQLEFFSNEKTESV
uniref:Uncharacterized protein n=1 Tax=Pyrodinium bahamense TaxID=73915 RepID=A0A7S0AC31_9DINO